MTKRIAGADAKISHRWRVFLGLLVCVTVFSAGFDRFDLFFGGGDFTLTPSIITSIVAIVVTAYLVLFKGIRLQLSARAGFAAILAFCFLLAAVLSVVANGFPAVSVKRTLLLGLLVVGIGCVMILAARFDLSAEIRMGAWIGLVLMLVMSGIQYATWNMFGAGTEVWLGPLNVTSPTYGPIAPRPSGISLDPNRASLHAVFFAYIIALDPWTSGRRQGIARWVALALAGGVVAAAGSRTGLVLWAAVALIFAWRAFRSGKPVRARNIWIAILAAVALLGALVGLLVAVLKVDLVAYLSERLDFSVEASGGMHFDLYRMAADLIGANPTILLTGIGFGNAPTVLEGMFAKGDFANFHSLFATALVETGLLGFMAVAMIMIFPLWFRGRRAMALVFLVFSIFYQAHLDGAFWVEVSLFWILPTLMRDSGDRDDSAAPDPDKLLVPAAKPLA